MTSLAYAIVGILSVLTLANLLLTFGIIRKLAQMQWSPARVPSPALVVGSPVPVVAEVGGHATFEPTSRSMVVFMAVDCDGCHAQLPDLAGYLARRTDIQRVVAVVTSMHDGRTEHNMELPLGSHVEIIEEPLDGPWQRAYLIGDFPTFFIVLHGRVEAASHHISRLPTEVG